MSKSRELETELNEENGERISNWWWEDEWTVSRERICCMESADLVGRRSTRLRQVSMDHKISCVERIASRILRALGHIGHHPRCNV